jgi:transposase
MQRLITACEQANLPAPARKALSLLADQLVDTQRRIEDLTAGIRADARADAAAQRLQTGAGPENDPAERVGRSSRTGNRYLRRRLHPGAIAQVNARRLGKPGEDWLWKILRRKTPGQAAVAPANRMA